MKIDLRKNHKFLSSSGYIKQICQPLEFFNIHMFTYLKKYPDGSEIYLSSDSQWIHDYYHLSLFQTSEYESLSTLPEGLHLWQAESHLLVFQHGREYYKSNHGFTICHKHSDGPEYYFFSFSPENYAMLNVCVNNLDLIEQFILYFKEKASSIFNECKSHKIYIPRNSFSKELITSHCLSTDPKDIRSKFMRAIDGNPLAKWLNNYEPLSKREQECLNLLGTTSTVNELADILKISKRTAETHVERIKSKLQCKSKQELLIKLNQYDSLYHK
jgi:DNA-binding CsgD family transcriptional regulator